MSEAVVLAEAARAADADDMHHVTGALEFVNGVAQTDVFALCGNQQMLTYAIGREVDQSCLDGSGVSLTMTIQDILRKLVLSDAMRKRATGAP
jgi:ribose 1,5-bisphosphokinase PhnN